MTVTVRRSTAGGRICALVLLGVVSSGCVVQRDDINTAGPHALSLDGYWVGEVHRQGAWQLAVLHITDGPSPPEGTLELPFSGESFPVGAVRVDNGTVTFRAAGAETSLSFAGVLQDRVLEGSVDDGAVGGSSERFGFAHLAGIELAKYTGGYDAGNDRIISISPVPAQDMGDWTRLIVQYTDTGTGQWGALFPLSETRFVSGGPAVRVFPMEIDVSFSADPQGEITGLVWRDRNTPVVRASKIISHRQEDVTFLNGDVVLEGTLVTPTAGGRHPAVVFTHGSGPQLRQRGILEALFARAGFAVLTYDKRGVGGSGGDWRSASFEELADDAVAGAQMLRARPDIDPTSIGFWGLSQGAWIAPLAAARFGQAAFVMAASGGGLSPERQELLDTEYALQLAGFAATEIADALRFQRTRDSVLRTGEGRDTYQAMRARVIDAKWYGRGEAWGPASPADSYWINQRRIYFYDPAVALERIGCPVLFVFGELDTPAGVRENVAALRAALARAGNQDVTIEVVPNAGHNLFVGETDTFRALTEDRLRYAPGYPQAIVAWAVRRFIP